MDFRTKKMPIWTCFPQNVRFFVFSHTICFFLHTKVSKVSKIIVSTCNQHPNIEFGTLFLRIEAALSILEGFLSVKIWYLGR